MTLVIIATLKNTDGFQLKYDNNTSERNDNTIPFQICADTDINCFCGRRSTTDNIM